MLTSSIGFDLMIKVPIMMIINTNGQQNFHANDHIDQNHLGFGPIIVSISRLNRSVPIKDKGHWTLSVNLILYLP